VHEDRQPQPSGHDGLRALRMVHALYHSADSGAVERVEAELPFRTPVLTRESAIAV
jgi:hypothetical protein